MLNPGSVSIPKEGNPPSYAVLENGVFTVKTLEGTAFMEAAIL
jgi:predicted phosphodiesterase